MNISNGKNIYFSVVLCVNKTNDFLDEAINSILKQTFLDFEFIIVANNCEDSLYSHLLKYKDKGAKVLRTDIGQLSFNLNYAVNESVGEYIVRMDSDDISMENRLDVLFSEIENLNRPDVIGSYANLINESGEYIGEFKVPITNKKIRNSLYLRNCFIHPSVAIKKSTLIECGGYLGGFNSEDYDLWLRLSRNPEINFSNVKEKLLSYRINSQQCKGSRLAYSEVSGHLLKEFLLGNGFKYLIGSIVSSLKVFIYAK